MRIRRYNRRRWMLVSLVATTLAGVATALWAQGGNTTSSQAARNESGGARQVSLERQLAAGLKAVTKADFALIDEVVNLVEQGKLSRRLVDSTFFWARERAARHRGPRRLRPMVYFRPALTFRAKAAGVVL